MKTISSSPRLAEIAAKAGVSMMTVSNVLRPGKEKRRTLVSEATSKRVLKAAEELGYTPNRIARSMRTRQTGVVGYVTLSFDQTRKTVQNAYVQPFLVGLSHALVPQGRHVVMVELDELEVESSDRLPLALRERFFDGLVVHWGLSRHASCLLEEFKVPIIYWDSGLYLPKNCVYRDEFEAGRLAANRLLELGHRRIGYSVGSEASWQKYLNGGLPYAAYGNRYEGIASAMKAYQVSPIPLIGYDSATYQREILQSGMTALVTSGGSRMAYLALAGLPMRIPRDFSVVSTDVDNSVEMLGEQTSGVTYNRYEAGKAVGVLLNRRLENGGGDVESLILPMEIVDAGTDGPAPEAEGNPNSAISTKERRRSGKTSIRSRTT